MYFPLLVLAFMGPVALANLQVDGRDYKTDEVRVDARKDSTVVVNCQQSCGDSGGTGTGGDCSGVETRLSNIESAIATMTAALEDCSSPPGPGTMNPLNCPPNYTFVAGICFKVFRTDKLSWDDAKAHCESEGPNSGLLIVEDQNVWNQVREAVADFSTSEELWIGLRKRGSGAWKWTNGNRANYDDWEESQPNGDGDCTRLNCDDYQCVNRWWDGPCSEEDYFICQHY